MYGNETEPGISKTDQVLVLLNRLHQGPLASSSTGQNNGIPSTIQAHKPWEATCSSSFPTQHWHLELPTSQTVVGSAAQDPEANVYKSLAVVLGDQRRNSTVRQLRYKWSPSVHPQLPFIMQRVPWGHLWSNVPPILSFVLG